jgi:hypothetical protein
MGGGGQDQFGLVWIRSAKVMFALFVRERNFDLQLKNKFITVNQPLPPDPCGSKVRFLDFRIDSLCEGKAMPHCSPKRQDLFYNWKINLSPPIIPPATTTPRARFQTNQYMKNSPTFLKFRKRLTNSSNVSLK